MWLTRVVFSHYFGHEKNNSLSNTLDQQPLPFPVYKLQLLTERSIILEKVFNLVAHLEFNLHFGNTVKKNWKVALNFLGSVT